MPFQALPEAERSVVETQLKHLEIVQRSPGKRLAAMYLDPDSALPLFATSEPEHCLARLKIVGNGRSLVVAVMSHRGRLSSLEFHGSPDRLGDGELKLLEIALHGGDRGVSQAIDRLEHGKQNAEQ